jgi:hypothetical protein
MATVLTVTMAATPIANGLMPVMRTSLRRLGE